MNFKKCLIQIFSSKHTIQSSGRMSSVSRARDKPSGPRPHAESKLKFDYILFFYHRFTHLDTSPSISSVHHTDDTSNLSSPNMPKSRSMESVMNASGVALKYIPSIEEVHVSSVVSRRGYLNFLEENGTGWVKKFVVCLIIK